MKDTLISTVEASLENNINKKQGEYKSLYDSNRLEDLAMMLLNPKIIQEDERLLGAEINSIESIIKEGYIDEMKNLYLLVSDTETGRKIGKILKYYFENSKNNSFERVTVKVTEKLDDQRKEEFTRYGLRNLVRNMAEILKKHGFSTIINATGGYKAQIAFALALGQGMNIPVYYLFERFPAVIKLPPLPLSLDYLLYIDYIYFIDQFDEEGFIEFNEDVKNQYKTIDEKLIPLFDIQSIDRKKYIELNPMGQVFVESAKHYFNISKKEQISLLPRSKELIFQGSKVEAHSQEIIAKYNINKKFEQLPFVEKVYVKGSSTAERSGKKSKVKILGNEIKASICTNDGILDLGIQVTARNNEEMILAKEIIYDFVNSSF